METFNDFLLGRKSKSKKKVTWLHSIFSRFQPQAFEEWYKKMDAYLHVHRWLKKILSQYFQL